MATILRYARYLKQSVSLTRRVNISQNNQSNVLRVGLHTGRVTRAISIGRVALKRQQPHYGYEKSFQNLEVQLRRSGRTNRHEIEKILSEVQLAGNIPSLEALLLVRCCGKPLIDQSSADSIQLVQEVWGTMESLKVPMDISHYNALLSVYLEKDHDFSPAEFLQMILSKNIEPNRVTYHRLIEAYCKKGDIANATKILEKMRENQVPLCETVFNSLIIGHSEAGDQKSSIAVLDTMKNAGIEPSVDTYCALLCVYAKRGDMESINKTIADLDSKEIVLLDNHYMEVIETLVANGHIEKAEVFSLKLMKDIQSDTEIGRLLVKLMDLGQLPLAITMMKNTTTDIGRFNIRSALLLKGAIASKKIPVNEVINLCKKIDDEGWHSRPFAVALYHYLTNNPNITTAVSIMKAWQEHGGEIREHYFWPILRSEARQSNYQGIIDTLHIMLKEFNITPSIETLRDYTVPFMFGTLDNIIGKLEPLGIPKRLITHAIAHRAVQDKKLRNAAMFMIQYPANYDPDLILESAAASLNLYDDTKSFVTVLRFLGEEGEEVNPDTVPVKIADKAVEAVLSGIPAYRSNIFEKFLNELLQSGLTISPEIGERAKSFFDAQKAEEVAETIAKLTSGELKPVPLEQIYPDLKEASNNEYIKRPAGLKISVLRDQFAQYIVQKNEEKVLSTLKQLKAIDFVSPPMIAQGLELFRTTENMEAAEWCYNEFKETCKDAILDTPKILGYATLLVKNKRLDEALNIINESAALTDNENVSRGVKARVRNLLEAATEYEDPDAVNKIFDFLKNKNYNCFDSFSLGPLVKTHVQKNNIQKAMEVFEQLCAEYKCTPYKNVLATALIDAEDANSLQKLTDLSTEIHGESNALVDLALLFLEAGRPVQAKKILDTSGIYISNARVTQSIKHFDTINRVDCLEMMTNVFRGVRRMDRPHLYSALLEIFASKNDWQRGLALWTEMQENDVQPTSYFLNTLSDLLKKNKQKVPFVADGKSEEKNERGSRQRTQLVIQEAFRKALENRDWKRAEEMIDIDAKNTRTSALLHALLIRACSRAGDIDRATQLVKKVLKMNGKMPRQTFTIFCYELLEQGKPQVLQEIGNLLDEPTKFDLGYYKILSKMEIDNNGLKKFIENFDFDGVEGRTTEVKIHFGSLTHALINDPTLVDDFEKWAKNLAENKGIQRGMHALWNYYFIKNSTKAEVLYNQYVANANSPLIVPIIEHCVENKDALLLKKLDLLLKSHPKLDYNAKARLTNAMLVIHNALGEYDEGLRVLQEATKQVRIANFRTDVLRKLKQGLEAEGKSLPFNVNSGDDSEKIVSEERLQGAWKA